MITGYTAIVDHGKLGFPLQAFSELRFDGTAGVDEIASIANEIPEVEAVYTTAGDPDALALLRVRDVERPQAGRRPDPPQGRGHEDADGRRHQRPHAGLNTVTIASWSRFVSRGDLDRARLERRMAGTQYGGRSAHHWPSTRNAVQNSRLARSSSSASSMLGTYRPWIDGVSRWISPGVSSSSRASGMSSSLIVCRRRPHHDDDLRLHDRELLDDPGHAPRVGHRCRPRGT